MIRTGNKFDALNEEDVQKETWDYQEVGEKDMTPVSKNNNVGKEKRSTKNGWKRLLRIM